jgi:hypothetical protein
LDRLKSRGSSICSTVVYQNPMISSGTVTNLAFFCKRNRRKREKTVHEHLVLVEIGDTKTQ